MKLLAQNKNKDENFLFDGIDNPHTKRKLKKKFDNIINDIKKEIDTMDFQEVKN